MSYKRYNRIIYIGLTHFILLDNLINYFNYILYYLTLNVNRKKDIII